MVTYSYENETFFFHDATNSDVNEIQSRASVRYVH